MPEGMTEDGEKKVTDKKEIMGLIKKTDALIKSMEMAKSYAHQAKKALKKPFVAFPFFCTPLFPIFSSNIIKPIVIQKNYNFAIRYNSNKTYF
jgi:translation elongation factor EF-Tu-like GTPase